MAGDSTYPDDFQTANIGDAVDLDLSWPRLTRVVQDLAAVWNAVELSGDTAPGKQVLYFYVSDDTLYKAFRIGQDGTIFRIDKNTGSDATPAWTNMVSLNIATLLVTLPAGLTISGVLAGVTAMTLAGDLNLGGNDITNVNAITATTINGVDPSAHATRHAPGGADALAVGTPVAIGSANAAGAASTFPRSDHVHAGVAEIDVDGAGNLQGAVDFVSGDGVRLTRASNTITVDRERYHQEFSGGDDTLGVATEVIVQDAAGTPNLLQVQLTGADGSKDYVLACAFTLSQATAASDIIIRVRVGSAGNLTDSIVHVLEDVVWSPRSTLVSFSDLLISAPAANDWVTISIESAAATTTVKAASNYKPQLEVKAVAA